MAKEEPVEETSHELRSEKRRKKKERLKQHGKNLARIYADVVRKRTGNK